MRGPRERVAKGLDVNSHARGRRCEKVADGSLLLQEIVMLALCARALRLDLLEFRLGETSVAETLRQRLHNAARRFARQFGAKARARVIDLRLERFDVPADRQHAMIVVAPCAQIRDGVRPYPQRVFRFHRARVFRQAERRHRVAPRVLDSDRRASNC